MPLKITRLSNAFAPQRKRSWAYCLLAIVLLFFQQACTKKAAPFEPTDPLGIANKWVYDSMKLYYYWSDEMTDQPRYQLPTQEFFAHVLSGKDRFSRIINRNESNHTGTTAELMGFYYELINHPFDAQKMVGVVSLVIPSGPAAKRQLKRGMYFTKVNQENITPQNSQQIIQSMAAGSSVTLQIAAPDNTGTTFIEKDPLTIQHGVVPQKCVYANRYFEKNNSKTGYLAYFTCGESEDAVLLQSIQQFKNAGVEEMILDLRYNPGGSVASAAKLASVVVPAFNPDQVFVTFKGNRHGGQIRQSFRKTISFSGNAKGRDMQELTSLNLGLTRIFILTSHHTASAAELLANNLKPYLPVILIGEKTLGKDEASFRIEDKRIPRQVDWIMMPTVYKVADANGRGNYHDGLPPDHFVDEFSILPLQPIGLPGDRSVDKALTLVYGSTSVGTIELKISTGTIGSGTIEFRHNRAPSLIIEKPQ